VKIVDNDEEDIKSPKITADLLNYIQSINFVLRRKMGIRIYIFPVRSSYFENQSLITAFLKANITRLPALVTPQNVYLGSDSIMELYNMNLNGLRKHSESSKSEVGKKCDDFDSFCKSEMANKDVDEKSLGEESDVMSSFNQELSRRKIADKPAENTHASTRPDNVAIHNKKFDSIDDEVKSTIRKIAKNVDTIDSIDGEMDTPQDDFMERAMLENMMTSDID
jgi:hypothetical protein